MTRHKTSSRLLAMLLSLILVMGILPTTAFAQNSWGGTGLAEVQKDPDPNADPGLCAMGNNLVLRDGSNGGLTQVYYADAFGNIVGDPIDLSMTGLNITGDSEGGFDLKDIRLWGTYTGRYNSDANAFADLDVVIRMEGGTLSEIMTGNGSTAVSKSLTVYMSGGTLTGENISFHSAITAPVTYVSGGRIEKNLSAQFPRYLSGSPSIGGEGCGITVKSGEKFYLNGALSGASVYVAPKADFADGTVIAEGSGYQITGNDISQLHLTGDYAAGKELYLDGNSVKIRTRQVTAYNVWVGNTQVTEKNATDVLGDNTVSYDADTNTLTLNGLDLSDQGQEVTIQDDIFFASIFSRDDLNIVLAEGSTNTISTTGSIGNARVLGAAAMAEDDSAGMVSVSGSGSLSVTQTLSHSTVYAVGIFGREVDVADADLNFSVSGNGYTMGIGADTLNIQNADITCSGTAFGLTGTSSLSVSGNSHIKATGSMGALFCAEGTISVDTGLTILGSPQENDFENLSAAQVSSDGKNIVVGTETAKTVEITGIPVVSYLDESGAKQTLTGAYATVTSSATTWTTGWYVVDGDVTIDSRVTVTGDVKLIIKDGASLTVNGGILVPSGSTFTVYGQQNGTGNLTSIGTNGNAGIGGDDVNVNFGTIILAAKGKIVATGDTRAAGIGGGGRMDNGQSVDGTIHIYRGIVEATGGRWAAGIGGGADSVTDCTIIIEGGTITAKGGLNNVGIGGTDGSKTITINSGNIKAYGEGAGAGIGGSYNASGGNISITGGVVEADSIGGGSAEGGGPGGAIVISGGVVTAERIGAGGNNGEGTFSTGQSGDAVIFAGSITDQSGESSWSGLIFEGGEGRIYGSSYTVDENLTIPANTDLIIESGKTLTVENGVTITNNGAIKVNNGGEYSGDQPANKVTYQIDWDTDGDGTVDDTTYVAYGKMPAHADGSKESDPQYTYTFTGWDPSLAEVTGPAKYTAMFEPSLNQYTVTLPSGKGYTVTASGSTTVNYDTEFTFTVTVENGYSKTDGFAVKANGTKLTEQSDGSYKVTVKCNTDITVEGVADTTAPSNLTVSYETNGFKEFLNTITFGLFFKDTVTVTITATDEGSGVKEISYQLGDDGELQTVVAENGKITFTVEPEFKGNIKNVTATDNAGNTSEGIDYEYFAVEKNKPADVTVDTNGYVSGKWTNGDVSITVSGSTATSGIAKYQYSTDGGQSWHDMTATEKTDATATDPLNVTEAQLVVSNSGTADYIFRAVSNAGNESASSNPVAVKIDKVQPTIAAIGNTDYYLTGDIIEITAGAGCSGITKVEVQAGNDSWTDITDSYLSGYTVTANGTYTFRVTNGAGVTASTSITYDKLDSVKPVVFVDSDEYISGNWTNKNVTLSLSNTAANLGTTTIQYKVDDGNWQICNGAITVSEETDGTVYTFKAISASGVESNEVSITVKIDKTAPEGDITIEQNSVKKFIHDITFGLFFNKNVDVTITGTDNLSGVAAVEYYRSEEILTEDDVLAIEDWTVYSSISETAEDAAKFVYYVKITDNAGNVTLFGSDGVTFDLTVPVIAGVTDGATYYTTQSVTVSDANLESITLNGETVNGTFTIEGNKEMTYTIVATDKAGNKTTYTVTMKPIASLAETIEEINTDNVTSEDKETVETVKEQAESIDLEDATDDEKAELQEILDKCDDLVEKIEESAQAGSTENTDKVEDITADNVKPEDKDDLIAAKEDLENALENFGDNYTEEEKAEIQNKLDQIDDALESLEKVETVEDAISKLPDTVEPDDTDAEQLIQEAKEQYDALTEHEKSLVSEDAREKLESLLAALGDYEVVKGDGSKWEKGTDTGLVFTANGAYSKFTGIEVDGKAVDKDNYTAVSGSTVITLKPEYLETLSVGAHTLTVQYTDGEASCEFTIVKKPAEGTDNDTQTPETGDNSNMMLWIALMLIAVCGLTGAMVYGQKKKYGK